MAHRLVIATLGSSGLGEPIGDAIKTVGPITYSRILDQSGAISFSVTLRRADPDVLKPGAREVHLYNSDDDLVWGGYLWVGAADDSGIVNFAGSGWFSRLKRRYLMINKAYAGIDQLDIAWDLISYAQGLQYGDLGITRATTGASGVIRDNAWYDYERNYIGDLVETLAASRDADPTFGDYGGFDYEVTPDKAWTTYYPSQSQQTSHEFVLGVNIGRWSYVEDGTQVSTGVTGVGGAVAGIKFFSPSQTTELQAAEFLPVYGLLQEAIPRIDIKDQKFLDAKTKGWARIRRKVIPRPSITVVPGDTGVDPDHYKIGDLCTVDLRTAGDPDAGLTYGWVNSNSQQRIIAKEITVSEAGNKTAQLTFAEPLSVEP